MLFLPQMARLLSVEKTERVTILITAQIVLFEDVPGVPERRNMLGNQDAQHFRGACLGAKFTDFPRIQ